MAWTETAIFALTDDAQTLNDGRKLATAARWSGLGMAGDLRWGLCQGSGSQPYQVRADATDYQCSCPSRKSPCKHVVALLLLAAQKPDQFASAPPPAWVTAWTDAKPTAKSRAADKPVDAAAQAKRIQAREAKVAAGMLELRRWLDDVARRGLTDERVRAYELWDRMAARMVDAQASGIANWLRDMGSIAVGGQPDWSTRLLDALSKLHLLIEAYGRLDKLPPDMQADIRQLIGWTIKDDEVKTAEGTRDHWYVLSNVIEQEDRLRVRRVWLYGLATGRYALLLDFAFGAAEFEGRFPPALVFDAELAFYPGAYPLRALVKGWWGEPQIDHPTPDGFGYRSIEAALAAYADALARNVWLTRFPLGFARVHVIREGKRYSVIDGAGWTLPMALPYTFHEWWTTAVTGNHPIPLFGEWDGYAFTPRAFFYRG